MASGALALGIVGMVIGACAPCADAFHHHAGVWTSTSPCSMQRQTFFVGLSARGKLQRTGTVGLRAGGEPEGGEEGRKSEEDAWKNAKSYDSGVKKGSFEDVPTPIYTREERVREAEEWLNGRSLFDKSTGSQRPMDPIRQQEVKIDCVLVMS